MNKKKHYQKSKAQMKSSSIKRLWLQIEFMLIENIEEQN